MPDLRVIKTKRAIRTAFLNLLENKTPTKITVSELVNEAEIGRGTFYLYYTDILDLYEHIIDDTFIDIGQVIDRHYPCTTAEEVHNLVDDVISYISDNRKLFSLFMKESGDGIAAQKLRSFFMQKIAQEEGQQEKTDLTSLENVFVAHGLVGLIEQWLISGCRMPQKKFAKIIDEILEKQWELKRMEV